MGELTEDRKVEALRRGVSVHQVRKERSAARGESLRAEALRRGISVWAVRVERAATAGVQVRPKRRSPAIMKEVTRPPEPVQYQPKASPTGGRRQSSVLDDDDEPLRLRPDWTYSSDDGRALDAYGPRDSTRGLDDAWASLADAVLAQPGASVLVPRRLLVLLLQQRKQSSSPS